MLQTLLTCHLLEVGLLLILAFQVEQLLRHLRQLTSSSTIRPPDKQPRPPHRQ